MAQEKKMKFNPCFIEAFRSGQKITTYRPVDFYCRHYEGLPEFGIFPAWFHREVLGKNTQLFHKETGKRAVFFAGTEITWYTSFCDLQKRAPYQPLDKIKMVTECEGGEIIPFATATIDDVTIIDIGEVTEQQAINDGFGMYTDPVHSFYKFTIGGSDDKYWLYTFTNIQMLPMWGGAA